MALFLALLLVLSVATPSPASPDLDFYKGKVINYIVATKPGGGYDLSARMIGKYLQKHIPGAGHIIGANETYLAKPDGLTIGTFNTGLIYSQIVGLPGIRFNLTKYSWIGKAASVPRIVVVSRATPYKSMKDLVDSKEPVKMGSSGVGSAAHNETLLVAVATGANLKVIPGYTGNESEMAMLRGEISGHIGSYDALVNFIRAGEGHALLQIAGKKHRDLPEVPLAADLPVSPKGKKLLAIVASVAELARLTAAPPGVPPGRLRVLRDAYKKAVYDPDFLKEAARVNLDVDAGLGDAVGTMIGQALNQPAENLALLRNIIKVE